MPQLINKKAVRQLLLDIAGRDRAHSFTRVAPSVYDEADSVLINWARRKVQSQPSKGQTVR